MSKGRPQDVGRTRPLALHIRQCEDIPGTSAGDVIRMLVDDVPWCYIEDHMGVSIEHLLGTSRRWFGTSFSVI